MSRKCEWTGKKVSSGQNRPFSLKATKRTFRPNLFWKKMWDPVSGKVRRMRLSTSAIRTLKKYAEKAGQLKDWKTEKIQKGPQNAAGTGKHVRKEPKLTPVQKKELAAQKAAQAQSPAEKPAEKETSSEVEK